MSTIRIFTGALALMLAQVTLTQSTNNSIAGWGSNQYGQIMGFVDLGTGPMATRGLTVFTVFVAANVTSYIDTVPGTGKYHYRVQAFNAYGNSAWSNWAEVNVNN
jgi:hypothetical protein